MPRTKKPLMVSGLALMVAVLSGGGAGARHNEHRQPDPDSVAEPMRAGQLGAIMTQLIHDCEQQAAELKDFPADEIAQSITLDGIQANALKRAQSIAHEAAEGMAETCPPAVPVNPADRLDMLEREIDGMDAAVKALQPPLKALYASLSDDQKAHLVLRFAGLEGRRSGPPETTGSDQRVADDGTRRRSKKSGENYDDTPPSPRAPLRWNCDAWQAQLRAWPVGKVEQSLAVGPRQRAAFYELAAAVYHAADTLADACPKNTSVTPVARADDLKKKLDAVRKSIAIIRSALVPFYDVLDEGQKTRFNDAI